MKFTIQDLKNAVEGELGEATYDTSMWLVNASAHVEFPMTEKEIIEVGRKLGASGALTMWDNRCLEEKTTYHEPENVVFFMGPKEYLWWARERLEHGGIVSVVPLDGV